MTVFNPFDYLGSEAAKIVADGWTAVMVSFWSAGLWVLKYVLTIVDAFMTPDIRQGGPAAEIYKVTFWMGVALLSVLVMVQIGVAAFKRTGESMARLLIGVGQFVLVWAAWLTYAGVVIAGAGGLTTALLQTLLGVDTWAAWQPTQAFSTEDITDGTLATVLGFMGLFLWLASIGHFIVMLARAAALMVLVATAPISAAGLSTDLGRPWFWKSLRWFHAAAFSPVLMVLVLGIGVQITTGVVTGQADSLATTVGTAIPGVFLICIGSFSPLALFKLLAFVDPGTSSGAAMRSGLSGVGGVQGLMSGGGGDSGTSSAASSTNDQGQSQAETSGESDTSARTAKATSGLMSGAGAALGPVGAGVGMAAAAGLGAMVAAGTKGAVIGADVTNQMGVGSNTYVPDFSGSGGRRRGFVQNSEDGGGSEDFDPDDGTTNDDDTNNDPSGHPAAPMPSAPPKTNPGPAPTPAPPSPQSPPSPGATPPTGGPAGGAGEGAGGAGAAAGGGAAGGGAAGGGAAAVPPV